MPAGRHGVTGVSSIIVFFINFTSSCYNLIDGLVINC